MNFFQTLSAQFNSNAVHDLREWRMRVLDGILRGVFILWVFALIGGINNVFEVYRDEGYLYEDSFLLAASVIAIYLAVTALLTFITFNRKLKFELRATLLLFVFYALGTIGMALSSFSGDGRIFFFAFIILAAIFFNLRYSLSAFILTFLTLAVIGWLQVSGTLVVPAENQINSTDVGAWISGGIVLLVLGIAALISITYLLQALNRSLTESRESLAQAQRLSRLLRTLSDVNQLIVREQDAARMLQRACEIIISERGYIFSWISLLEADGITLKLAASAGETIDSALFTASLSGEGSGPSCAVAALRSQQPFLVEPAEDDPCLSCPLLKKYPHRSSLALPIVREAHVFGVLTVVHPSPSGVFDDEEIKLLVELADDLAYALEKLESEQRVLIYARHQALLNEITQTALETPDLETMIQKFIEGLEKTLDADGYYFALWDEARQLPVQFISSDMFRDALSLSPTLKPGDRIFSQSILDSGRVLAVDDVMNTPYISPHLAAAFPIRSALGLPLIADNHKLGALVLGFREPYPFTAEEIELAGQASRQIALAMLKARLDADTRAKTYELGSLYAAAQDLATSIMDPPALLEKLARHMTEALKVTSGSIMSVDLAEETMQVVGEYWGDDALSIERHSDFGKKYSSSDYSTIIRSMIAGQVLIIHADSGNLTDGERKQFRDFGIQSMMFVPIMAHGQLFGNIELWESRRRREFTLAEIHLAQAMAGHAASIIQNANLVNALRTSEARYRTLIEQASDGIFIADAQRRYVEVNSAGCQMLGYTRDEILNMTMDDLAIPEDIAAAPFRMQELIDGKTVIAERLLRRKDGSLLPVEISAKMLLNGNLQGIARDITERKLAERALAKSEAYFRALIENSAEGVAILDANGLVRYVAPSEERLTGYTIQEAIGQSVFDNIHPDDIPRLLQAFQRGIQTSDAIIQEEYRHQRKNGEWRNYEVTGHNMLHDPHVAGVVVNYRDITERKRMNIALLESEEKYRRIYENLEDMHYQTNYHGLLTNISPSVEKQTGYKQEEVIGHNVTEFYAFPKDYKALVAVIEEKGSVNDFEARLKRKDENLIFVSITARAIFDANGQPIRTEGIIRNITERKQAEQALRENESRLEAVISTALNGIITIDSEQRIILFNPSAERIFGYAASEVIGQRHEKLIPQRYQQIHAGHVEKYSATGVTTRRKGMLDTLFGLRANGEEFPMEAFISQSEINGQKLFTIIFQDITERKRAEEDLRRHALELETLAAASAALRTAQNVSEMIPILAKQAMRAIGGDYGSIFLLDPESGDYVSHGWFSARGESKNKLKDESILRHRPGEGITGHVAVTGDIYVTEDMQKDPFMLMLAGEKKRLQNLHGGISLPLRAQEKIIGVMHIWMFERHVFSETEIRILIAFAETAGNAIHRAMLFEQTLQHADELALAYDNTLAGWARALELRDEITEGHTRRVTEITLQLARALNIPENELVQIRRGALLHDIGKMGIPDSILHKPGPFTAQERTIMEQHTQYAYDMISSISFLQPALDIPFCHHEYWNGNGYPRKLKREQIPLAARIFSVVDVWDALTSDRPYRKAWSKKKTREYILERAGKQFDPRVVEVFFSLEIE